jgi:hypothetical protein
MFTINVLICTRLQFDSNFLQSKSFNFLYQCFKFFKNFNKIKFNLIYVEVANVLQYSRNPFSNEFNLNDLETYRSF